MKTRISHQIVGSIAFSILALAHAADPAPTPAEFWLRFIKASSLEAIASKMEDSKPAWPTVRSTFYISSLPPAQKAAQRNALAAIHELHLKLAPAMRNPRSVAAGDFERQLEILSLVGQHLRQADGYSNLVLADGVERLFILNATDWMTTNPTDAPKVRAALERLPSPTRFDLKQRLLSLVDEDSFLSEKREEVGKVDGTKSLYEALAPLGIGMQEVLTAMQREKRATGRLLREPSAINLLVRLAETDALRNVHLAGLIAFFEKGGRVDELNPSDESAFEKRMGKETRQFRSPALQIRYLSSEHLLALIQMRGASNERASYLAGVLE
jgi:hypothetical protein